MWSVLDPAFAGAAAGLALGLVIVLLLKRLRAPGAVSSRKGRWISARYADRCGRCAARVLPGERVVWDAASRAVTCERCSR